MLYSCLTATDLRLRVWKCVVTIALPPNVLTVPPLVLLTGSLPCQPYALCDLRPCDAESYGMVDEHAQFGIELVALESCQAYTLQHLSRGKPDNPFGRAGRRR
jgi:hypothetical protein